jgi:CheY-like chemotaxis protein
MDDWEGPRKLKISVVPQGEKVLITLADTGPGIPEEICAKIFEPFFTTKPEGRGTGLGLPVCRQIVVDHGGELKVTTEVGHGTTFSFELPVTQPAIVAAPAPAEQRGGAGEAGETGKPEGSASAPATETPTAIPEAPVPSASLLLVEDEAAVRELLTDVLTTAGHRVEAAPSLEAASAMAASGTYDIVVSDVQLDDGTGVDLHNRWANLTTKSRPPFLFLSGDSLAGAIGDAAKEEDVYMLQKPVDLRDLRNMIGTILAKHHAVAT